MPAGGEQDAEVERVLALGARRIDIGQGDVSWVVLADPEGNEFCILRGRADSPGAPGTSRLTEVLIDCADGDKLAEFWGEVLGWKVLDRDHDAIEIGDGEGGVTLVFLTVPEPKTVKNRLHLDLIPVGSQDAEVERVLALGARRLDIGQGNVSWEVMADPEGNEFCILSARP